MHFVIYFLLSPLIFNFALAAKKKASSPSCKTISYESKMGPPQDQGNSGWCFAYAAADMIGFTENINTGKQISGLALSSNFYSTTGDEIEKVWTDIHQQKIKTEMISRTDDENTFDEFREIYEPSLNQDRYLSLYQERQQVHLENQSGGFFINTLLAAQKNDKMCLKSDLKNYELPRLDPLSTASLWTHRLSKKKIIKCSESRRNLREQSYEILNSTLQQTNASIQSKCTLSTKNIRNYLPVESFLDDSPSGIDQKKEIIHKNLTTGKIIGIAYNPGMMMTEDPGIHAAHASTIIGQKSKNGKCFFQVRNTWGSSCEKIKSSPDVHCEHGGSIWVSEDTLLPSLTSVIELKLKTPTEE